MLSEMSEYMVSNIYCY